LKSKTKPPPKGAEFYGKGDKMPNKLLKFDKFNKRGKHNSEIIQKILKNTRRPTSLLELHLISGIRKDKLSQNLKSLSKYGIVRKKYYRKTSFWVLNKGDKNE
jgi:hypothetical protein